MKKFDLVAKNTRSVVTFGMVVSDEIEVPFYDTSLGSYYYKNAEDVTDKNMWCNTFTGVIVFWFFGKDGEINEYGVENQTHLRVVSIGNDYRDPDIITPTEIFDHATNQLAYLNRLINSIEKFKERNAQQNDPKNEKPKTNPA